MLSRLSAFCECELYLAMSKKLIEFLPSIRLSDPVEFGLQSLEPHPRVSWVLEIGFVAMVGLVIAQDPKGGA